MIAAPAQLSLHLAVGADEAVPEGLWENLPDPAQAQMLALIARLIARRVVVEDDRDTEMEKENEQ